MRAPPWLSAAWSLVVAGARRVRGAFVGMHHLVARLVLGRRLIELDNDCRARSTVRRALLLSKIEALEARTDQVCRDAHAVPNGHH
jgi:hypothetical protein